MSVKNTRSALVVLLVGLLTLYAPLTYAYHFNLCMSKEQYIDQVQALNPDIAIITLIPDDLTIFKDNYNAEPPLSDYNITDVVIGIIKNAPGAIVAIAIDGCVKIQAEFSRELIHKMLTKLGSI